MNKKKIKKNVTGGRGRTDPGLFHHKDKQVLISTGILRFESVKSYNEFVLYAGSQENIIFVCIIATSSE